MARIPERKFDPARPVFARKYFVANGHHYAPGMAFPWRNIGVMQRRVLQMFEAGKICHNEPATQPAKAEPTQQVIAAESKSILGEHDGTFPDNIAAEPDDLDAIDDMKELRRIADAEGAPYKVSKADQRQAIRDHRKETD